MKSVIMIVLKKIPSFRSLNEDLSDENVEDKHNNESEINAFDEEITESSSSDIFYIRKDKILNGRERNSQTLKNKD